MTYIQGKTFERPCTVCGTLMTVYPSWKKTRKFCSMECRDYREETPIEELLRLCLLGEPIIFNGRKYWESKQGYHVSTKRGMKQLFIHREIWKRQHGSIPEGSVIHHIDHNKSNNHLSNLEIMTLGEHTILHKLTRTDTEDRLIIKLYNKHENGAKVAKQIGRSEFFTYGVLREYGVI